MGHCCSDPAGESAQGHPRPSASCPRCGAVGRGVSDATLEAILSPGLATSLLGAEPRFCRTGNCPVLYYGVDGLQVDKGAARVRVGLKETTDPLALCYCFGFSSADVYREVEQTGGSSTIPAQITARVRAGECACETNNPSGACCLGEVNKAVKEAQQALQQLPNSRNPGGIHGQR